MTTKQQKPRLQQARSIRSWFLILLLSSGCIQSSPKLKALNNATPVSTSTWSCETKLACVKASESRHMCRASYFGEDMAAWGQSQCEAQEALRKKACAQKIDPAKLSKISCSPDPTEANCPSPRRFCTFEFKPTQCQAQAFNGTTFPPSERPSAWASNPCLSRIKLHERACDLGLSPKSLDDIVCESTNKHKICPPPRCKDTSISPTRCTLDTLIDYEIEEAWEALGQNECEARYKLHLKACIRSKAQENFESEILNNINCQKI